MKKQETPMNTRAMRTALVTAAMLAAAPSAVAAHAGHAGDHGWLFGALQPLLAVDHALAGLFVAGVVAALLVTVGVWTRTRAGARRLG
jgi:hydrogenase/urease accessory protein HupE